MLPAHCSSDLCTRRLASSCDSSAEAARDPSRAVLWKLRPMEDRDAGGRGSLPAPLPYEQQIRFFNSPPLDIVPQLEVGKPEEKGKPTKPVNGIFWILLLNLAVFVADHLFQVQQVKTLYLYHSWPAWYQFVTATFCHADWNHLSSNLFFLYIFGKLVEEEEGNFGLWISYIVTGVGANLVSWLVLPRSAVSMGASGAVFGLFAISVLVKLSWDWRKILEVFILGQFVIDRVMEAAQASIRLPGAFGREVHSINHIAHFSGALIGVALMLLIAGVPSQSPDKDVKAVMGKDKK